MSVPALVTRASVEEERPSAEAWAARHDWTLRWDEDGLGLSASTTHPVVHRPLELRADLSGYPTLPPSWRFVDPETGESPRGVWPAPGEQPGVAGSIFHGHPCICAPWNRLAYEGGPHQQDWLLTEWTRIGSGYTKADQLADMLDQIHQHLRASPGFQQ